jgi:hypothetical protein
MSAALLIGPATVMVASVKTAHISDHPAGPQRPHTMPAASLAGECNAHAPLCQLHHCDLLLMGAKNLFCLRKLIGGCTTAAPRLLTCRGTVGGCGSQHSPWHCTAQLACIRSLQPVAARHTNSTAPHLLGWLAAHVALHVLQDINAALSKRTPRHWPGRCSEARLQDCPPGLGAVPHCVVPG